MGQGVRETSVTTPLGVRGRTEVPLDIGLDQPVQAELISFHGLADGREHLAIRLGDHGSDVPLVRMHSECLTGDVFGSRRCDCGPQLREALVRIHERGGYLLYLRQEGRGIGLYNKLDAYRLQAVGHDTYSANRALGRGEDERDYTAAAQMLHMLGADEIDLLTNNPNKAAQLLEHGIRLRRRDRTGAHVNPSNYQYLEAKALVTDHSIDLGGTAPVIRHRSPISGIAAFQNSYVATAGYDNQVILWEAAGGRPLGRAVHDHLANQVSFSPDGKYLLTSSSDYTARLWSVPELKLLAVLSEHEDDVEMSAFHPSEPLIATASRDHRVRVFGFDGKLRAVFEGHTKDVISVEWASDGDQLISSSDDGTIKRWSLSTGRLADDIDMGGVETDTIALTADGTVFAGNDDGEIVVVAPEGTSTHTAHSAGIKRLVHNAERSLLISLSYDRSMGVWDTSGELALLGSAKLPDEVWPRSCAFLNGDTLVFATFGSCYATYHIDSGQWETENVEPTPGVNAVTTRQGRALTIGDAGILWEDGRERARMGSLCNFLTGVGPRVVTGGQLGIVFDALTGEELHQHRSPLNCAAAFVRGGRPHVVVGTYTGEGLVFSLTGGRTFRLEAELRLHGNAVKGVAVAGSTLFSVSADAEAVWFSTETLTEQARLPEAHGKIANGCAGLGNGEFASVSRDLKLRIWSGTTARVLDTPHDHSVKCISADEDGRHIATGGYHGLVAVYDRLLDRWTTVTRPTTAGISSLHYDAARKRFLAGSYDGTVYDVPLKHLAAVPMS